jgi:hypothetical protein
MRRILILAALVAGLAGALLAPSGAGAQVIPTATLDVTKVVEGEVPPGTTFTIEVSCPAIVKGPPTDDAAVDAEDWGGGPEGTEDIEETLTFGEEGGTQSVEGITIATQHCTITETDTGGAEAVTTTAGAGDPDDCNVTPGTTSGEIDFDDATTCEVIVTNTFPEPEPAPAAQAVTVGPTFTG